MLNCARPYQAKVSIGRTELYHADCLALFDVLQGVDAIITDPPYGQIHSVKHKSRKKRLPARDYPEIDHDDRPFCTRHGRVYQT